MTGRKSGTTPGTSGNSEPAKNSDGRFGAHVSVAGGVSKAFVRGEEACCDAIAIFSKNQAQWKGKPLENDEIDRYHNERKRSGIGPVVIHDSYLINLCAPDPENYEKSFNAFADEIERAEALKAEFLNFHPGSHLKKGEEWGLKKVAESLNLLLDRYADTNVQLLIETTAGQGTNLGWRFEHIRTILDGVERKNRLGVCVDTAHIHAAGYDIRTPEAYGSTMRELDDVIGLDLVKAFHMNDSKKELGSRVDRHEHIGKGHIGLKAFELLVNDPSNAGKPMICETPGGQKYFRENIERLRRLAG